MCPVTLPALISLFLRVLMVKSSKRNEVPVNITNFSTLPPWTQLAMVGHVPQWGRFKIIFFETFLKGAGREVPLLCGSSEFRLSLQTLLLLQPFWVCVPFQPFSFVQGHCSLSSSPCTVAPTPAISPVTGSFPWPCKHTFSLPPKYLLPPLAFCLVLPFPCSLQEIALKMFVFVVSDPSFRILS